MEKKLYIFPLIEVAKIKMSASVLTGSPVEDNSPMPDPSHPGAPERRRPAF